MDQLATLPFRKALAASQATFTPPAAYTKGDFASDQAVRWCPGCGDYAILAAMQRVCMQLGKPPHEQVFISGIGCAARFPYYMNAYGFHTIHGRAPGVATGLALTRPNLTIWLITGDGDGLSIGAGHLLHLIRRNVNVNVLLFNNRIYGLTKGQYSPTSERGKVSSSSPFGSLDEPFDAIQLAHAARASFTARVIDRNLKLLEATFRAASEHVGTAFIEIYQNCNIFNDGAFTAFTDRELRSEQAVFLEEGAPLRYGKHLDKVITWDAKQQALGQATHDKDSAHSLPAQAIIHNSYTTSPFTQAMYQTLADDPAYPTPFGIFNRSSRPTCDGSAQAMLSASARAPLADPVTRDKWLQEFISAP